MTDRWHGILDRRAETVRRGREFVESLGGGMLDAREDSAEMTMSAMSSLVWALHLGEIYWISKDMMQVVEHAAETMPVSYLHEIPAPSKAGFVEFATPIDAAWFDKRYAEMDVHRNVDGLAWHEAKNQRGTPAMFVCTVGIVDGLYVPIGILADAPDDDHDKIVVDAPWADNKLRQLAETIWVMVQQTVPYMGVTNERVPRAEARRARRVLDNDRMVPDIRVVRLRMASHSGGGDHEARDVNWSHRWIVSGHWRRQWYPSLGKHGPVYIYPHVKGPEDKPLVVKQEIRALVR